MNAKPGNVSITGETTIPFTIAKAKQNITAETESESVHVNTEEPITVNGLGEVSIVSENEEIAVVTEEKMIRGKKKGTAYLKISAAGDDNHEAAETKIQISVNRSQTDLGKFFPDFPINSFGCGMTLCAVQIVKDCFPLSAVF